MICEFNRVKLIEGVLSAPPACRPHCRRFYWVLIYFHDLRLAGAAKDRTLRAALNGRRF